MTNDAVAVPYSGGTRECSSCGCYTPDGYIIRKGAGSFFVCPDCYQPDVYPLASRTASLPQKELEALPCRNGRLCFGGGYLLGRQEEDGRFIVQKLLSSSCTGPVLYFNRRIWPFSPGRRQRGCSCWGFTEPLPGPYRHSTAWTRRIWPPCPPMMPCTASYAALPRPRSCSAASPAKKISGSS